MILFNILKCSSCWFSSMFGIWNISLLCPTSIIKYYCNLLNLEPLFHSWSVLVEMIIMFGAFDFKIVKKEIQLRCQDMNPGGHNTNRDCVQVWLLIQDLRDVQYLRISPQNLTIRFNEFHPGFSTWLKRF